MNSTLETLARKIVKTEAVNMREVGILRRAFTPDEVTEALSAAGMDAETLDSFLYGSGFGCVFGPLGRPGAIVSVDTVIVSTN